MLKPDWKRITINVEPELEALAKKMAKKRRQSVSAYLASLLENDAKQSGTVAEEPAPYGKQITPNPAIHNPKTGDQKRRSA